MAKKTNHYTIMFVPENNGKTFTLRVHKAIVKSLIFFLILFILGLGFLLFKSGEIAAKLQLVYTLRMENKRLSEENKKLRQVSQKISKIESLAQYLERLAHPSEMGKQTAANISLPKEDTNAIARAEGKSFESDQNLTALNQPTFSDEEYGNNIPNIIPVDGWITRGFSTDSIGRIGHYAYDYAAALGTPIKATAPGTIELITNDKTFGLMVIVKHDYGFSTKYCHCSQVLVSMRDRVHRGQTIALVGNTGRSSAPHLHYEIFKDGKPVDPKLYLIGQKH